MTACPKTLEMALEGVVVLPGEDQPWEPWGVLGTGGDGKRPAPDLEASIYRDRLVSMGRKGRASALGRAGRLILEHGDDARRMLHREVDRLGPSAERLLMDRHLEWAGLAGLEQMEAFA